MNTFRGNPLDDFLINLAAGFTQKLLERGGSVARDAALGTEHERALQRVLECAFEHVYTELVHKGEEDEAAEQVIEALRWIAEEFNASETLFELILGTPTPSMDKVSQLLDEGGFDYDLVPTAEMAAALIAGFRVCVEAEASVHDNPLFEAVVVAGHKQIIAMLAEALNRSQPPPEPPRKVRIFLSYARSDDEPFVKRLYEDLKDEFDVWWDRVSMPSRALTFLQEIRDAIVGRDRLVLVVGPGAVKSDYVYAEWRWAQVAGKVVTPVLRLGDFDLLPESLDKIDCRDFRDDAHYDAELQRLIEQLRAPAPRLSPLHGVPLLPTWYIDRGVDVDDLLNALTPDTQTAQDPIAIVSKKHTHALHGMPGLGKSTLAAALGRHINTRRRFPDGVFWIELGGEYRERGEPPPISLRQAGIGVFFGDSRDNYPPDAASGKARLTSLLEDKAVLLILDDVWDHAHAQQFQVIGPRGRILLTTRKEQLVNHLGAEKHTIDTLTEEEGLRLFAERLETPVAQLPSSDTLREIVRFLGGHTLAVDIAAGWLIAHGGAEDAPGLLRRLEKTREGEHPFRDLKLKEGDRQLDLEYALSLSYADLSDDLRRRFRALGVFATGSVLDAGAAAAIWGDEDPDDAEDCLYTLLRAGLLDQPAPRRFSQHSLLNNYAHALLQRTTEWQEAVDEWQIARRRHAELFAVYAQRWWGHNDAYVLAMHLPNLRLAYDTALATQDGELLYQIVWHSDDMLDMQGLWNEREAWLRSTLDNISQESEDALKHTAQLRGALADLAANRGAWDEAETLQREALAAFEQLGDRREIAVSKGALADLAAKRGAWDEAETLYREALAAFEQLGDRHSVAVSKGKLANLAAKRGAWDEAETLHHEALAVFEQLGDRREIAVQKGKLADLAAKRGAWDEAETLHREALAAFEQLGDRHSVAVSKGKLADLAANRGAWDEAETLYREALAAFEQLGDRRSVAVSKGKLADLAANRGAWDEAETLYREALAAFEQLGDRHSVAASKGKLADLAAKRGAWDEAETLHRETLAAFEQLGDRYSVAVSKGKLADLAAKRGAWDEAETLRREVMREYEQLGDRRSVAVSKGKLADLAANRGAWDEAETLRREALAAFEQLGDRRSVAVSKGKLADLAANRGAWDEAETLHREALAAFEQLGDRHSVAASKGKLADLAANRGAWDEAETLRREVMREYEQLGDRRGVAVSKGKLADLAANRGAWDEAETLYREALATYRDLGALWDEAVGAYNFAGMQHKRGKLDDAIALMERVVEIEAQLNHPDLANDRQLLARWQQERAGGSTEQNTGPSEEDFAAFMQAVRNVYVQGGADAVRAMFKGQVPDEVIEAIIAQVANATDGTPASSSPSTLPDETVQVLAGNTVGVKTGVPEKLDEWRDTLHKTRGDFASHGPDWEIEVAFADALLAVLNNQPAELPESNPYASVVRQVVEAIEEYRRNQP